MRDENTSPSKPAAVGDAVAVGFAPRPVLATEGLSSGIIGWFRRMAGKLVAQHVCTPPSLFWAPIPSHLHRSDGSTYLCPECEQVFAGPERRD